MIVSSLLDGKKYFWVKVPRTATHSYQKLFFSELLNEQSTNMIVHTHASFSRMKSAQCANKPNIELAFGLVRHPKSRFISGLRHLQSKLNSQLKEMDVHNILSICEFCGEIEIVEKDNSIADFKKSRSFFNFLENEEVFYNFIYTHFGKNSKLNLGCIVGEIFQTENPSFVTSMFVTQTEYAYHPQVKTFRYENLSEFNYWIEKTLGYSTNNLEQINSSNNTSVNIDFTTKKFDDVVRYLFQDDYEMFGYS